MTQIITTIKEMKALRTIWKKENSSIGFVPTMGALHDGHLSLVKASKSENDITVMSIFVNPLQFGPNEDYNEYPRPFENDVKLATNNGVDYIFYPSVEEIYPKSLDVTVKVGRLASVLEGKARPGHFDGVVTIVNILFNIIQPTHAYFGKKDAQQLAIIQNMVNNLHMDVIIKGMNIIRETDGLAKSSRNIYLNDTERKQAPLIQQTIQKAVQKINQGELSAQVIEDFIINELNEYTCGNVSDVGVYSYPSLKELETIEGQYFISVAHQFSVARLIDNYISEEL